MLHKHREHLSEMHHISNVSNFSQIYAGVSGFANAGVGLQILSRSAI